MLVNRPSHTAQGAAMHRAAHQLVDQPLIFEDPLALRIIGREAESALRAGHERWTMPEAANMRAFVAVRSRYAEDCCAESYERGVRQCVVLGAGLDTFAYRGRRAGVRVFEVDQPATQEWKRQRLTEAGIAIPANTEFVSVDFERDTMREGLKRARFDFSRPAFFAWLGVTPYLTRDAIMATLEIVAKGTVAGSEIVFDFAAPAGDDPRAKAARERFAARVDAVGEPIKSEFVPAALTDELRALGFTQVAVTGSALLNARYFDGRKDGLALRGGQIMRARV